MRIGVALDHTCELARAAAGLSRKGRRDYLTMMLRFEGLSDDEVEIGLEYADRKGRLRSAP